MSRDNLAFGAVGLFAAGVLSAVVAACGGAADGSGTTHAAGPAAQDTPEESITVQVAPIRREPLSSLYSTGATLRAEKQATVTARTHGVIRALLVEEGDQVEEGQILARLEKDEQEIAFRRAQAVEETLKREFSRTTHLHEQGLISQEKFETVRRNYEDAQQAASLAALELSRTEIRSPFAGTILARYLDLGATVHDGTSIYEVADLSPLFADINVPERNLAALKVGQQVRLTVDASGRRLTARIQRIAPAVDPTTGTVKVTLAMAEAPGVRPGAFVRADIVTDTHPQALVVPRKALVAQGNRWHLFRLADENRVQQVEVKTGFEEGDRGAIAAVLTGASPLQEGTPVGVAGAPALSDGARVRLITP
ncbi:MAG: efflux RND transporter periplasmic adaptor subunit [Acidobacteriota bacterium]